MGIDARDLHGGVGTQTQGAATAALDTVSAANEATAMRKKLVVMG
jgi:hypothetical protein